VTVRAAALAGMVGPVLFAATLLALSVIQYHFMLKIGWRPLANPAGAWPSGLALGPYGWIQTANFILSGVLLMLFAAGLHLETKNCRGSRMGSVSLFVAGAAMALMGFDTDPIRRTGPRTPHGLIHDLAFALFVVALLAALFLLWWRFREDAPWRDRAHYTLATGVVAALLLLLPGVAYYLFIGVVLVWFEATALRLWRLSG
jgi:uncharacterized membrane protein YidH (DUF202 family)